MRNAVVCSGSQSCALLFLHPLPPPPTQDQHSGLGFTLLCVREAPRLISHYVITGKVKNQAQLTSKRRLVGQGGVYGNTTLSIHYVL